jgi:hypothetical protein
MTEETVTAWTLFGDCGELRCDAQRCGDGFQLVLSNEGVILTIEWVSNPSTLLQRSREVREKLRSHGFRVHPPRSAVLHGGPSWGPNRPSTVLLGCIC